MAYTGELRRLERRRHELVAESDHLRETLAGRCLAVGAASFWVQGLVELAQRALTSHAIISSLLRLFRKGRK